MKDPTDTRDIGPRVGSPLWLHMTLVTIVGAAVFALCVIDLKHVSVLIGHPLFWVLAGMVVLGEIWPIVTPGRSSQEAPVASVTFSFAALIAWGLPVAVLLRGPATMLTLLAKRKAPHRAAFNAAVATLGLVAGGSVLHGFRGLVTPSHPWIPRGTEVWQILLAAAACFAVSYVLDTVAVALHAREP